MSKYFQRQARLTLKLLLQQEAAKTLPETILNIKPAHAAALSLKLFFEAVERLKQQRSMPTDTIRCVGIKLKCSGRDSLFELIYYSKGNAIYAIDLYDSTFVCKVVSLLK